MRRELLVSAAPGEWRAALLEDGTPVALRIERGDGFEAGSVHLGRVARLVPALDAALVDIGGERPAFLPQRGIVPRGRRLAEGEPVLVQIRREAQDGKAAQLTTDFGEIVDAARRAGAAAPPQRLFPAPTIAAALAGVLPPIAEILVDELWAVPELRAAFPDAAVRHAPEGEWPLDLDALVEAALAPSITLAQGASVHFVPTPAAVMIDVDSGSPETGSPARVALATNLAAAAAIARHIRLRNLAGGIVIDFVGVEQSGARGRLRAALADALAADPMAPQILGWTRLGHLELVRRRRTRSLAALLLEPAGGGSIKTAATVAFEALRALRRAMRSEPGRAFRLTVATEVAAALAGEARPALAATEQRFARKIAVTAANCWARHRFEITPL
jgi:ribonuclease G